MRNPVALHSPHSRYGPGSVDKMKPERGGGGIGQPLKHEKLHEITQSVKVHTI